MKRLSALVFTITLLLYLGAALFARDAVASQLRNRSSALGRLSRQTAGGPTAAGLRYLAPIPKAS